MLAHVSQPGTGVLGGIAAFGADWLYVVLPGLGFLAVAAVLTARGRARGERRPLDAFAAEASRATGLPGWCAAPQLVLVAAFFYAVQGFLWDVAWHIGVGRDEFLFSPPHVCLLLGIGLLGVAGVVAIVTATRAWADVGWRAGPWRVPYGAAALVVAGAAAGVGFWVDELWHWAYGLDVSMWSPPHLTMISAAAFSPLSAWLLLAEARPPGDRRRVPALLSGFLAVAALVALSAWQLEFDLGVPQWQQAFHPLLVALAAGFGLTAARAALGRGGALVAVAGFVVVRLLLTIMTTQVWDLPEPRFVPYVAAAVAVELVFAAARRRPPMVRAAVAGVAVVTVGIAGAALVTQVWSWHPWTAGLLRAAPAVAVAGVATALLGTAFGRVVAGRPGGLPARAVAVCLVAVVAALASAVPRTVPDAVVVVRTTPATPGWVFVDVDVDPVLADGADRFGIMAWQGGGLVVEPLRAVAPGRYATDGPVPVHGTWKTMVRIAHGSRLGAVAVYLPADPAIGARAVPLVSERTQPFMDEQAVLLREAHDGPVWPGIVGYVFVTASVLAIIGLVLAGAVALDRRRARADAAILVPMPAGERGALRG